MPLSLALGTETKARLPRRGILSFVCQFYAVPAHTLAFLFRAIENRRVNQTESFARGSVVLVTLNNPREKFWGAILDLTAAGLSMRGIDLNSFDDFANMLRSGEPVAASSVFFPMHRVERVELDARSGSIPSLRERFAAKTGCDPSLLLDTDAGPEGMPR